MYKRFEINKVFISILILSMLIPWTLQSNIFGETGTGIETETKSQIDAITAEEQEVLVYLYTLEQEIQGAQNEESIIADRVASLTKERIALEVKIDQDGAAIDQEVSNLGEILKLYQKKGAGSFLEIILESNTMPDLIRRINTIRDLARSTDTLVTTLDANQQKLLGEKELLRAQIALEVTEQAKLQAVIDEKNALKTMQEIKLADLEDQRAQFEELLLVLHMEWESLKPVFALVSSEFSKLAESGSLPADALNINITFSGIEGRIQEEAFNQVLSQTKELKDLKFDFQDGLIELMIPNQKLKLQGNFVVVDKSILVFEVISGSFYDLPLEKNSLEELFQLGGIRLDLKPLLLNNQIKDVESQPGELVLGIIMKLF